MWSFRERPAADAVVDARWHTLDRYLLQKSLDRAVATGYADVVCAILNNIVSVLQRWLLAQLTERVNQNRGWTDGAKSNAYDGSVDPSSSLCALNSLAVCAQNLKSLERRLVASARASFPAVHGAAHRKVRPHTYRGEQGMFVECGVSFSVLVSTTVWACWPQCVLWGMRLHLCVRMWCASTPAPPPTHTPSSTPCATPPRQPFRFKSELMIWRMPLRRFWKPTDRACLFSWTRNSQEVVRVCVRACVHMCVAVAVAALYFDALR